jgi:hypothetical protein
MLRSVAGKRSIKSSILRLCIVSQDCNGRGVLSLEYSDKRGSIREGIWLSTGVGGIILFSTGVLFLRCSYIADEADDPIHGPAYVAEARSSQRTACNQAQYSKGRRSWKMTNANRPG